MPNYDGIRYEPLAFTEADLGSRPGVRLAGLQLGEARSYNFAPDPNAGNRPTSGQIYPRGVR